MELAVNLRRFCLLLAVLVAPELTGELEVEVSGKVEAGAAAYLRSVRGERVDDEGGNSPGGPTYTPTYQNKPKVGRTILNPLGSVYSEGAQAQENTVEADLSSEIGFSANYNQRLGMVLRVKAATGVDDAPAVAGSGGNLLGKNGAAAVLLDQAYFWGTWRALDWLSLSSTLGFFGDRANTAGAAVTDDLLDDVRGAEVSAFVGDSATGQESVTGRLALEFFQLVSLKTVLALTDWDRHRGADLSVGLSFNTRSLLGPHQLSSSLGFTADLQDTTKPEYRLKVEDVVRNRLTDTLTVSATYQFQTDDVTFKFMAGVGLNNMVGISNREVVDTQGASFGSQKLRTPKFYLGWHAGLNVHVREYLGFAMDLSGRGEKRVGVEWFQAPNNELVLANAQPFERGLFKVYSRAIQLLTHERVKGELFLILGVQVERDDNLPLSRINKNYANDYLFRTLEVGFTCQVLENENASFWLRTGYGAVLADPQNSNNLDAGNALMRELPGIYIKGGAEFRYRTKVQTQ